MAEGLICRRGGSGKPELKSISITSPPSKLNYLAGETFDPTGMVVVADIGGESVRVVDYTVSPTLMTDGLTSVTISYTLSGVTRTATQAIASVNKLVSISITTPPNKTAYRYGEAFNPTGMVVTAMYTDGSEETVTRYEYSPTGALTHETTQITVSYTAGDVTETATQNITVTKVVSKIEVTAPPAKTSYIKGETISVAGMAVKATYSDNSTADVTSSCTYSPTTATEGTTALTIYYAYDGTTKTTVQPITVTLVSSVLAENNWSTISMVSAAGMASEIWKVGDQKTDTIDGVNYVFTIIGFDHDNLNSADAKYSDASYNNGSKKAGITFQMQDIYGTTYYMNSTDTNTNGWNGSYMRETVMPQLKGKMPTALQNVIRTVSKLAGNGGGSSSGVTTSADTLFLLSEIEVFGTSSRSVAGEGSRYSYYAAGNSTIKKKAGTAHWWWLRSPRSGNTNGFVIVDSDGTVGGSNAYFSNGVAAGFCV